PRWPFVSPTTSSGGCRSLCTFATPGHASGIKGLGAGAKVAPLLIDVHSYLLLWTRGERQTPLLVVCARLRLPLGCWARLHHGRLATNTVYVGAWGAMAGMVTDSASKPTSRSCCR